MIITENIDNIGSATGHYQDIENLSLLAIDNHIFNSQFCLNMEIVENMIINVKQCKFLFL